MSKSAATPVAIASTPRLSKNGRHSSLSFLQGQSSSLCFFRCQSTPSSDISLEDMPEPIRLSFLFIMSRIVAIGILYFIPIMLTRTASGSNLWFYYIRNCVKILFTSHPAPLRNHKFFFIPALEGEAFFLVAFCGNRPWQKPCRKYANCIFSQLPYQPPPRGTHLKPY